jgi:proline iminopeptidase
VPGIKERVALFALMSAMAGSLAAQSSAMVGRSEPPAQRLSVGEHTANLGDVTLWYRVSGKGPYLVASSVNWGAGSDYLQTPGGISPLEREFTLIYFNTRGTPPSGRPSDPSRMGVSDMVDDLERLRVYWGLPKLNTVGHSGGGFIVLGYAERYPEKVGKLVLLDTGPMDLLPSPRTKEFLEKWRDDPRYSKSVAAWHNEKSYPHTDEGVTRFIDDILSLYFYDPVKYQPIFKRSDTKDVDRWVYEKTDIADTDHPMQQSAQLGRVTAKSLVIVGRGDFICPVELAQTLAKGIAGSKLVVFENTGHFAWIESREPFLSTVSEFLRD